MRRVFFYLIAIVLHASSVFAGHDHPEKWYQKKWCDEHGGQMEVVMPDKTRCDCVTATHAIEFDFASKWAEAIGQALNYATNTGKRAGIVFIIEHENDARYLDRVGAIILINSLPIDVWTEASK